MQKPSILLALVLIAVTVGATRQRGLDQLLGNRRMLSDSDGGDSKCRPVDYSLTESAFKCKYMGLVCKPGKKSRSWSGFGEDDHQGCWGEGVMWDYCGQPRNRLLCPRGYFMCNNGRCFKSSTKCSRNGGIKYTNKDCPRPPCNPNQEKTLICKAGSPPLNDGASLWNACGSGEEKFSGRKYCPKGYYKCNNGRCFKGRGMCSNNGGLAISKEACPPGSTPENQPNATCDANSVNLMQYPQWQQEGGYWIGEYSLYGGNGDPFVSPRWNYLYDHYRGFITGNVQGNAYRQRNVFMYPPQKNSSCQIANTTVGVGLCGTNGNMKLFEADQSATTCDLRDPGAIEGPYGELLKLYTKTELIGRDNSLLYQVWLPLKTLNEYQMFVLKNPGGACTATDGVVECRGNTGDRLLQSQLTTLTKVGETWHRTRTAQGFEAFDPTTIGKPTYASYYRERKVSKEEFWAEFNATKNEYQVLDTDVCTWKSSESGGTIPSGLTPGHASCVAHLEESFAL